MIKRVSVAKAAGRAEVVMMKKWVVTMLAVAGLLFSGLAVAEGTVFDTAGHEKVSGIRILVTYPKGFDANEHMDGYVVQEFTRKSGALEENLTLQLFDVDEEDAMTGFALPGAPSLEERLPYWKKPLEFLPTATIGDIRDARVDGRPAVFTAVTMMPDGMYYLRMRTLNIYDNGKGMILTCSVSAPPEEKAAVDRMYEGSTAAVCRAFFDSVKLLPEKR